MSGETPTSHRHRSPLCTVVHNTGRWCTTKSCTTEEVHNVALTNSPPHTQLDWQDCIVHHLCGSWLRTCKIVCAPPDQYKALPKYTLVQNYIVNLDLHVCCQPQKYYTKCLCLCAPPVYVCCQPTWKWKVLGASPTSHGHRYPACTMAPYCVSVLHACASLGFYPKWLHELLVI